jgi:hypothetical protein
VFLALSPSKEPAFSVAEDDPLTTKTRLVSIRFSAFRYSMNASCCPASHAASMTIKKLSQRRRLHHRASLQQAIASCSLDLD